MTKINNLPSYAMDYTYIVTRLVGGEHWFYGAYDSYAKAEAVAEEIGGYVQYSGRQ
jgi:hypothetical protein